MSSRESMQMFAAPKMYVFSRPVLDHCDTVASVVILGGFRVFSRGVLIVLKRLLLTIAPISYILKIVVKPKRAPFEHWHFFRKKGYATASPACPLKPPLVVMYLDMKDQKLNFLLPSRARFCS